MPYHTCKPHKSPPRPGIARILAVLAVFSISTLGIGCGLVRYETPDVDLLYITFGREASGKAVLADGAHVDFEADVSEQAPAMMEAVARGVAEGVVKGAAKGAKP